MGSWYLKPHIHPAASKDALMFFRVAAIWKEQYKSSILDVTFSLLISKKKCFIFLCESEIGIGQEVEWGEMNEVAEKKS